MSVIRSIKELVNILNRSKDLLGEMFEKRKLFAYKYDDALEISDEDVIEILKNKDIIRQSGQYLEIDEQYLEFFEQILQVNEEINISYINENIKEIKQNINYYFQESDGSRRFSYLKSIKSSLRKIGKISLRNIVDLNRNIDNTFKTEPSYKIKIAKLENYDRKRQDISLLIEQTDQLVSTDELTFFRTAIDEELKQITNLLRLQLMESRHNLIETQKQIIEFLNQIKFQSKLLEQIRQVKYLKDQFELKGKTNFVEVITSARDVFFEVKPAYPLKLSIDGLQMDSAYESILKVAKSLKVGKKIKLPAADAIATDYLLADTEVEVYINLDELKNSFVASGNHLFDFIQRYQFPREVLFDEKLTIFCQTVSLYENELDIREEFKRHDTFEYAVVYPK
ncbi:MAG: hypothetical protein JST83_05345 [Bacteroidetes bacterium]|nr:hypothetical protein [Bacteroidota bacterium]